VILGAGDELEPGFARGLQRAHDAGERALVGDRQRRVAVALRALEQLARAGSAARRS
jgi:hypothetical protein